MYRTNSRPRPSRSRNEPLSKIILDGLGGGAGVAGEAFVLACYLIGQAARKAWYIGRPRPGAAETDPWRES